MSNVLVKRALLQQAVDALACTYVSSDTLNALYTALDTQEVPLLTEDEIDRVIRAAPVAEPRYAGWVSDQRLFWGRAIEQAVWQKADVL